jgi:hypothetical protein
MPVGAFEKENKADQSHTGSRLADRQDVSRQETIRHCTILFGLLKRTRTCIIASIFFLHAEQQSIYFHSLTLRVKSEEGVVKKVTRLAKKL